MDVAKRLADWRNQPPEQWLGAANRVLPPVVTAVLVIAIAYQAAMLTWTLVPSAPTAIPAMPRGPQPAAGAAAPEADYSTLASAHLFGVASQESAQPVAETVVDAPDTTLSLTLTGILFAEGDLQGQAIISSSRGQEKTYQIGQSIDNTNGATLHSVYSDRVLLDRDGRVETLRLPKELAASSGGRMPAALPPSPPPGGDDDESLQHILTDNAARLTDIVRIAPHVQEGKVVGFRVNPGRDRATFEALGLAPGDVVTDINGVVLDDPSQGLQVFESLGEASMANVTVLRDGVPQVIVIDTSQLQGLDEENRE